MASKGAIDRSAYVLGTGGVSLRAVTGQVVAAYALGCGLLLSLLGPYLLPAKFRLDDFALRRVMSSHNIEAIGGSYGNTAGGFVLLGLDDWPRATAILGVAMFIVVMAIARCGRPLTSFTTAEIGVLAVGLVLAGIFLGQYSKEFFVLPIALAIVANVRHRSWELMICGAMAVHALLLRPYWWVVLAVYIGFRLSSRLVTTGLRLLCFILSTIFAVSITYSQVVGEQVTNIRRTTLESMSLGAATRIQPPNLPAAWDWLEVVYVWATLILPFPLLIRGLDYAVFAVAFMIFAVAVVVAVRRNVTKRRDDVRVRRSIAVVVAFLITLAMFEPDYGSYVRHLTPIMPVLWLSVSVASAADT